ncbi:MAG: O-methyltransferase [Halanaeroarchaeum sp.]
MTRDVEPTILSEQSERFIRLMAPARDDTLEAIEERNLKRGFPMVGPEVGGVLYAVARMVDAERVFEFGSGLGYSAYWFAAALPPEGLVVLTEEDESELDVAREFFERGGMDDRAAFELGDAHDALERYEGPFDVALLDHGKKCYAKAFEAITPKLAPGGVVIADNTMAGGTIDLDHLVDVLNGGDPDVNAMTAGIAEFLTAVRSDSDFDTVALPIGSGITISVKRRSTHDRPS